LVKPQILIIASFFVRKNGATGGFEGIKHARIVLQKAVVLFEPNRKNNSVKNRTKQLWKRLLHLFCNKQLFISGSLGRDAVYLL
jgi:hypothetical protein